MDTTRTMLYSSRNLFNKRFLSAAISVALSIAFLTPVASNASRGGIERTSNSFTVGMTFNNFGEEEVCSGALLSPTFILTAAHCVINKNGQKLSDYIFTAPGKRLDDPVNPATNPKILKTYIPTNYVNSNYQDGDDIAFIQLDRPLATKGFIRIANAKEVAELFDGDALSGFGYGAVYESGASYSIYPREYPLYWSNRGGASTLKTNQVIGYSSVACAGDSGGPIVHEVTTGNFVLIGNMSGAASVSNRCGAKAADGNFYMRMTVAHFYLPLVQSELTKSLTVQSSVKKSYKITCIKGKLKKILTGANPKCPTGYKQTAKVLSTK